MRKWIVGLLVALAACAAAAAPAAAEDGAPTLAQERPSWYTEELEARILAAGKEGVEVELSAQQQIELNCLGTSPPYAGTSGASIAAVSAGGCMIAPHGCTMNFIFTDGVSKYIGTAGHCVAGGRDVVMQVATRVSPVEESSLLVTFAKIGTVAKTWNAGIGRDFAIVKIDPGWNVVSGVAGALGPTGVFCGDPLGQPVMHYGHGYIFFVEQGHPKFGEVIPDVSLIFKPSAEGFNWVGYGLPGDSGSGVMNAAGLAVGDLTHGLALAGLVPVPGLSFGTTMQAIFNLVGPSYSLVTVDGRAVNCAAPPIGI
ncbi:MAG: S1 family peptidase [Actinomycetota bacterium]|nr:S1 family peptidase [Actinomycetota bacterium]